MQKAVSKVFKEYSVPFNGTYRKEIADGVTYKDQGKLPLIAPTIELEYEFPFCQLFVEIDDRISSINEIRADDQFYKYPERELFEIRMDKLYIETKSGLEGALKQVLKNKDFCEKYPRLFYLKDLEKIIPYDIFTRFVTIQVDVKENDMYSSEIESLLKKQFDVLSVSEEKNNRNFCLKDGTKIYFERFLPGSPFGSEIWINSPFSNNEEEFEYNKKRFEEIKMFFLDNKLLKERNAHIDTSNYNLFGNHWVINFNDQLGYPILEEMFRKDIVKLKKS